MNRNFHEFNVTEKTMEYFFVLQNYLGNYPQEYFKCVSEAKRSLEDRKHQDDDSYEFLWMKKALKLLKKRLPNE